MAGEAYRYVVVGGGLAGGNAIEGIREIDPDGSVLLIGSEKHRPYDRPPLSKQLWFGKKRVENIFLHDEAFYGELHAELLLGREVTAIDAERRQLRDSQGETHNYEKLLLATGGAPRKLDIPGGDLEGVCYYRYLDDYLSLRQQATEGKSALVIGGGFIGSEIAAALNISKLEVTMLYPSPWLCSRVFPEGLGRALQDHYEKRGVKILSDRPVSCERRGSKFLTTTSNGAQIESDLLVVGVGILPLVELAKQAGLRLENGIDVNERLETSRPEIYAAGDNAFFPYQALGLKTRVEHWDNAIHQGKQAGRNLAGAKEPYTYLPYFYSDLFEFGYEAVGEVDSQLETFADWQKENEKGVVYYLKGKRVRGAMMCDVWDKVEAARELIEQGKPITADDLQGAIR